MKSYCCPPMDLGDDFVEDHDDNCIEENDDDSSYESELDLEEMRMMKPTILVVRQKIRK